MVKGTPWYLHNLRIKNTTFGSPVGNNNLKVDATGSATAQQGERNYAYVKQIGNDNTAENSTALRQ
jgi:hypothetical protein